MAAGAPDRAVNFFEQNVTWLYSDDLEGMAAFYAGTLALPQVLDQGRCRVFRISPSGFLGVCNSPHRPRGTKGMMVTFLVADVQAAYAHFRSRGIAFDGPPHLNEDGTVCSCFFRDPEGYWLELQEFRDPRWPHPDRSAA